MNTLTILIVFLGAATVGLSGFVAYKLFIQHSKMLGGGKKLTSALVYLLIGEACLGAGTLAFAVMAHTGHLPNVPIPIQSLLRLTMFLATALTTAHLYMVIKNLRDD